MFRCLYFGFLYKQVPDENELVCEVVSCGFLHYLLGNKPLGITCFEWRAGLTLCIVVKWKLADPRLVRIKKQQKQTNKQRHASACYWPCRRFLGWSCGRHHTAGHTVAISQRHCCGENWPDLGAPLVWTGGLLPAHLGCLSSSQQLLSPRSAESEGKKTSLNIIMKDLIYWFKCVAATLITVNPTSNVAQDH